MATTHPDTRADDYRVPLIEVSRRDWRALRSPATFYQTAARLGLPFGQAVREMRAWSELMVRGTDAIDRVVRAHFRPRPSLLERLVDWLTEDIR